MLSVVLLLLLLLPVVVVPVLLLISTVAAAGAGSVTKKNPSRKDTPLGVPGREKAPAVPCLQDVVSSPWIDHPPLAQTLFVCFCVR